MLYFDPNWAIAACIAPTVRSNARLYKALAPAAITRTWGSIVSDRARHAYLPLVPNKRIERHMSDKAKLWHERLWRSCGALQKVAARPAAASRRTTRRCLVVPQCVYHLI